MDVLPPVLDRELDARTGDEARAGARRLEFRDAVDGVVVRQRGDGEARLDREAHEGRGRLDAVRAGRVDVEVGSAERHAPAILQGVERARAADALEEIASLLAVSGENPFKIRAFENAARTVSRLDGFEEIVAKGEIGSVKGIGKAIAEILTELSASGRSAVLDDLRAQVPSGVLDLMRIPGLGPKKAAALWKELGVTSLGELQYALRENRLATLPGFGVKSQEKLALGLQFVASASGRFRLPEAWARAESARAFLLSGAAREAGVTRVEVAGDLRRFLETVDRVVLAVACEDEDRLPPVPDARNAPPVTVVAGPPERFGNVLLEATGSEEHLAALRARGAAAVAEPAPDEADVYARLGLAIVPPELREGRGEMEAAAAGALPRLLELGDVQGLFHLHTTFSDGKATLEETFRRAVELGYSYVGITDHSPAAAYAGGLTPDRVREQWAAIDALRPRFPSLTVFRGTEADILPDGSVDYGDDFLAGFDFVIASVHSAFHLARAEQTARVVRAVRNARVTLLGHATGRLLLSRDGFDVDMDAVLAAAGEAGCGVEINASPYRLDLDWRLGAAARAAGVFTSINPDAHDLPGLLDARWGVGIARKAGFAPEAVLNAASAGSVAMRLGELRGRR